uniref:Uncharacterized protein n=1 Tax=Arundo donax TaxID=35708 RepID=A0A0A9F2W6_ARUDO
MLGGGNFVHNTLNCSVQKQEEMLRLTNVCCSTEDEIIKLHCFVHGCPLPLIFFGQL